MFIKCVNCDNVTLVERRFKGSEIVVDHCPQCHGIWFDKGELDQMLKGTGVKKLDIPDSAYMMKTKSCPNCVAAMSLFKYPGTHCTIEMCAKCEGVWLDDNELQDIYRDRKEKSSDDWVVCSVCHLEQANHSEHCDRCDAPMTKKADQSDFSDAEEEARGLLNTLRHFFSRA